MCSTTYDSTVLHFSASLHLLFDKQYFCPYIMKQCNKAEGSHPATSEESIWEKLNEPFKKLVMRKTYEG